MSKYNHTDLYIYISIYLYIYRSISNIFGLSYYITVEDTIRRLKGHLGSSIDADIELADRDKSGDFCWELGIGDEERGDAALVQHGKEPVDLRVPLWHQHAMRRWSKRKGDRSYMIGSPTRERAQCLITEASFSRSARAPGTPVEHGQKSTYRR